MTPIIIVTILQNAKLRYPPGKSSVSHWRSKCLPQSKQSPRGDLVNDCHAEVLARRGFNLWCLKEMRACIDNREDPTNKFRFIGDQDSTSERKWPLFELVNPESRFYLYVSQAPCGDATTASLAMTQKEESKNAFLKGRDAHNQTKASIQGDSTSQTSQDETLKAAGSKHLRETTNNEDMESSPLLKQPRIESPPAEALRDDSIANRTLCPHVLGFRRGRVDYDSVGVLRTKPGRVDSEPTTSMSCSDKIARWNTLGLCSSLVAPLLPPIYLHSIITYELFDSAALKRALFERIQPCDCVPSSDASDLGHYRLHSIQIHKSSMPFDLSKEVMTIECEKDDTMSQPAVSSSSISWIVSEPSKPEVLANGCKAGASAKQPIQPKAQSRLCKVNMFRTSVNLWKAIPESALRKMDQDSTLRMLCPTGKSESGYTEGDALLNNITYDEWKGLAKDYNAAKKRLLKGAFQNWTGSDGSQGMFNIHGDILTRD
ncbi:adenosine deaminase/editase [Mortierella sp. GBAus27b]|nr:adenosine deaminase/editase [Mortierella sp. GBAus27b]